MTLYAYAAPRHFAGTRLHSAGRGLGHPTLRLNIHEDGDAYVLTAPVPGLQATDLKIQVLEDILRIEGKFPIGEAEYLLQEIPGGEFQREVRLPAPLEVDQVEARISEGVLTLRLPKAETARPHTIKVAAN